LYAFRAFIISDLRYVFRFLHFTDATRVLLLTLERAEVSDSGRKILNGNAVGGAVGIGAEDVTRKELEDLVQNASELNLNSKSVFVTRKKELV
jgi:hypothetical protein